MDKYYYLVAQLPTLYFDKESTMTIDFFLEEAQKWLSRKDYKILSSVSFKETVLDKKGPRLWLRYRQFEHAMRRELADWRTAVHAGQEYKPSLFPLSMVKEGTPLEVEKKLLAHRWHFIDELEKEHYFDLEFLILYFLKLQILQQLSLFDQKKGMELFQKISKVSV